MTIGHVRTEKRRQLAQLKTRHPTLPPSGDLVPHSSPISGPQTKSWKHAFSRRCSNLVLVRMYKC